MDELGLRIRIEFNADPDPAFFLIADPDRIQFWIQGFESDE
jgi:hypothetical protein